MFRFFKQLIARHKVHSPDELLLLLRLALSDKTIDTQQLHIIEKIIKAKDTTIAQAMIAKAQTVLIQHTDSLDDVFKIYQQTKHSRYPMMNEQEEIIGILLMKDLIALSPSHTTPLSSLLRQAHVSPESQSILSLLNKMQRSHHHMSIVVDEYGCFSGIVTIEDLLEEIVGDIEDEHDDEHPEYIQALNADHYLVHGRTPIEQFNQHFGTHLTFENFDTIAGILSHLFGYVPQKGEHRVISDYRLTILQTAPGIIEKIKVERIIDSKP